MDNVCLDLRVKTTELKYSNTGENDVSRDS